MTPGGGIINCLPCDEGRRRKQRGIKKPFILSPLLYPLPLGTRKAKSREEWEDSGTGPYEKPVGLSALFVITVM